MKVPAWARRDVQGRLARTRIWRQVSRSGRRWIAGICGAALTAVVAARAVGWLGPSADGDRDTRSNDTTETDQSASDEDPLLVTIVGGREGGRCYTSWMVPRNPNEITFTETDDLLDADIQWPDHPAAEGGNPASPLRVYVTVQGRTESQVTLRDVRIHVRRLGPAPVGTLLNGGCGDTGSYRWLSVDLDDPDPVITSQFDPDHIPADTPGDRREPIQFPYEVSSSDSENFLIEAHTRSCDCEWWAEISWSYRGRSGTVMINDHGRAFRTIADTRAVADCTGDGSCVPR